MDKDKQNANFVSMEWQTKVAAEPLKNRFSYATRFLFAGSCFAQELAARMRELHFLTAPDAFGPLFNPASLVSALERLEGSVLFDASQVEKFPYGGYGSLYHHTSFSRNTPEDFLEHANDCLQQAATFFRTADTVVLTLGTARAYMHNGKVVANCHKLPGNQFTCIFLEPEQIANMMIPILQRNPDKLWVMTVSPIRHWGDGAHGNQLSKASLLMAIESIQKVCDNIYYFPSYEIVMDELRDYRFYAADRCHLTRETTDYMLDRFFCEVVDEATVELVGKVEKLNKSLQHRPFFPETTEYATFVQKLDKQKEELLKTIANQRNL